MGFESRAISARVTKQIVTILVKHVIMHLYSDALACCRCMTLLFMTSNGHDEAGKRVTRFQKI